MNNGKLIVLEGIDGSGKSAQYRRLCSRFEEEGIAFRHIVFPRYDQESSALIRMYLGGAFGKISTSLVNDIIMPAVSMLVGGINFSDWKIVLKQAVLDVDGVTELAPAVCINYGTFLSTILDFLIIAFAVFCLIRFLNNLHRKKEEAPAAPPAPPEPSAEEKLLTEIRDLLKDRK